MAERPRPSDDPLHAALTETARALREAGDPRGVDALRFDLVMGGFTDDDSLPAVVVPGPRVEEHLPPAPLPFPAGADAVPQVPVGAERSDNRATSPAQSEPAPPAGPPDPLWQAREQAERVLEAAHAAEAEALHRLQQVRAEHDRLIALVVRERLALSSTLPADRRASRPVQLLVHVPVTTLVGLAHEPGYLEGYGWIGAPQCRQLLPTAELRQVCTDGNGMVIDLARRAVRAGLSPAAAREALLRMATEAFDITDAACEPVDAHDPPRHMADLIRTRGRFCDGPLGTHVPAGRSHLDHAVRHPDGPTAPWNIAAQAERSHVMKHHGWTPVRTVEDTLWTSPAGQVVMTARHQHPPEPLAPGARLPDPDAIHVHEAALLRVQDDDPDW